jgi:hypothetical protein
MNSMKYTLVIGVLSFFLFNACDDVDTVIKYQACCGSEPVEFVKDSYHIYVPNCFTPNGDNINDIFLPMFNSNIVLIKSYEIYSNDDFPQRLFFSKNINVFDLQSNVWYGRDLNNNRYVGKFKYKFVFISDVGKEIEVQGSGCAIICGEAAAIFYERKGCFFGTQLTNNGFNSFIPSGEDDCFNH